jgi:hypothetical protein
MTVEQYKQYLISTFGMDSSDADKASREFGKGIAEASSKASKSTSSTTKLSGSVLENIAKAAASGFYDRLESTQARISVSTIEKMVGKLSDIPTLNPIALITNILNAGADVLSTVLTDLSKLNDNLLESTKGSAGYVGEVGNEMIKGLNEAIIATTKLGISVDDFLSATKSLMTESGRMAFYSEETIYAGMEAAMAYTKSSQTLLENSESFRNVGLGLNDAAKSIADIGKNSVNMGLSAKATSEVLIKNLGMLNQYGFQNGIKGLGKMVQEAQALKINIDDTFKVAEKLYDPEGAISLAANLQVIGGAFGDLGDPIKLMYDATNNVESLQTSIIGAARSLATYNAEQGRFEVTGVNLRRAKAMSDALGISMGELTNMAVKGAAKFEAMSQLDIFPDITEEQKEFVSNLATMKDGRVGFDLPNDMAKKLGITNLQEGFVAMDDLNSNQLIQLKGLQEANLKLSTKDIAREQLNYTTQMASTVSAIYLRLMEDTRRSDLGGKAADALKASNKFMDDNFDPTKMSTKDMLNKVYNESTDFLRGQAAEQYEAAKKMLPDVTNFIEGGYESIKKATKEFNMPESFEDLKKAAEPVLEKGKELLRDLNVSLKVDVSGNNPLLANMLIEEIRKNPQTKADFVSILTKDNRVYT